MKKLYTFIIAFLLASLELTPSAYAGYSPFGDIHWKAPVASAAALPAVGNMVGDARFETTDFNGYIWNGTTWLLYSGSAVPLSVGTIDSQSDSANGGVIAENQLFFQTATASFPGLVTVPASAPVLGSDGDSNIVAQTGLAQALAYPVPTPSPSGLYIESTGAGYALGTPNPYPLPSPSPSGYVPEATGTGYTLQPFAGIYVPESSVGAANGVAPLGSGGKIAVGYLPADTFIYQGLWSASANSPTLADGTGTAGYTYWVSTAAAGPISGLNNASMVNFQIGDLVIYNGTQWELTTPAAGVSSVNGNQGAVTVNAINQLTGDVTTSAASGSSSEAASVVKVNGGSVPTSAAVVGTNSSGQIVAQTGLAQALAYPVPTPSPSGEYVEATGTGYALGTPEPYPNPTPSPSGDVPMATGTGYVLESVPGNTSILGVPQITNYTSVVTQTGIVCQVSLAAAVNSACVYTANSNSFDVLASVTSSATLLWLTGTGSITAGSQTLTYSSGAGSSTPCNDASSPYHANISSAVCQPYGTYTTPSGSLYLELSGIGGGAGGGAGGASTAAGVAGFPTLFATSAGGLIFEGGGGAACSNANNPGGNGGAFTLNTSSTILKDVCANGGDGTSGANGMNYGVGGIGGNGLFGGGGYGAIAAVGDNGAPNSGGGGGGAGAAPTGNTNAGCGGGAGGGCQFTITGPSATYLYSIAPTSSGGSGTYDGGGGAAGQLGITAKGQ